MFLGRLSLVILFVILLSVFLVQPIVYCSEYVLGYESVEAALVFTNRSLIGSLTDYVYVDGRVYVAGYYHGDIVVSSLYLNNTISWTLYIDHTIITWPTCMGYTNNSIYVTGTEYSSFHPITFIIEFDRDGNVLSRKYIAELLNPYIVVDRDSLYITLVKKPNGVVVAKLSRQDYSIAWSKLALLKPLQDNDSLTIDYILPRLVKLDNTLYVIVQAHTRASNSEYYNLLFIIEVDTDNGSLIDYRVYRFNCIYVSRPLYYNNHIYMFGFTCTKGSRGDSTIITYDPGSHSIDSVIVVQLDGSRADMFCDSIVVGNKMYIGGHIIDKGVCLTVFNPDSNSVIETRCLRTNKTGCCNRVLYSNGVIYLIGALHDRVRYPPIPCLREYGYYAIYRNTRLWNKTSTKTIQLSPAIDTRYNISYTEYSLQLLNKTKHVEEIKILSASKTYDTVYSLYARPSTKVWFRVRGYDGVLSIESNAEVRIGSSTGYEVNITPRGMGVLYVYVGGKYVGEVVVVGDDNLVLFTNSTVLEWRYSNGVLDLWLKSRALVSVSTPRHGVVAIVSDYNTVCKGYRGCEILRDNDGVLVFTGKHIRIYTNKSLVKTTSSYSGYPLLGYVAYSTIPLAIVLVLLYRSKTKT